MKNIPTAAEYVQLNFDSIDEFDFESNRRNLIEFARIHVEAALKEASEKAELEYSHTEYGDDIMKVDKESILNAYPLTNIK